MAIDPNKKANGYKHVGCYYTNPWWYTENSQTAKFEDNDVIGQGTFGNTSGAAALMAKWTGGLCVPMFNPEFAGLGSADKDGDLTYSLTDPILDSTIKFYTDESAHNYPFNDSYARGNIWHSALAEPYSLNKYRIRQNSDGLYPSSDPALFIDKNTSHYGAFKISSPGSGLDHYTSYYWGGGSKIATTKIKNILGLYWFTATQDGKYYSFINKICLLYQNREGQEVPLIPIGNAGRVDMEVNDYMLKQGEPGEWTPPACGASWDGQKNDNPQNGNGVLRGAFLDPDQAKYVIENKLELKGMWIEVFRETPALAGSGNPIGIFSSFFPWILSETNLFGRYYLHPFDCMASKVGQGSTGTTSFRDTYYNDEEIRMRDDYFERYAAKVNAAGGWQRALIDPSGEFSKKILIPPLISFNKNPQNYSDDYMRFQAVSTQVYGGTKYITSNGL